MTDQIFLQFVDQGSLNCRRSAAIRAWRKGWQSWIEFRGTPYQLWSDENITPVQQIHDSLEGWHASVLHAGETLTLFPHHPDYAAVDELLRIME